MTRPARKDEDRDPRLAFCRELMLRPMDCLFSVAVLEALIDRMERPA